ncbi:hypothetical protein [Halopiger aswanensis]|uniref:hypothetical protein n=1 Tax=Halopiger aswanensis TaxID=148449 RepID=UPI001FE41A7D|nr:hypothetical protein [Halopiger aswanensis]
MPIIAEWHVFRFPELVFLLVGGLGVTIGGVVMTRHVGGRSSRTCGGDSSTCDGSRWTGSRSWSLSFRRSQWPAPAL